MFAALSQYMKSLKYTSLAQSSDASDGSTTRLQIHTFRFFNSRRLVILAATILFVLLLASFHFASPNGLPSVSQGWPSGPEHQNVTSDVDWSRFAYTQYATNTKYLCNSIMLFEILHRLGSKADRLLMYPSGFKISSPGSDGESKESLLLRKARDEYHVKLSPIEVVQRSSNDRKLPGVSGDKNNELLLIEGEATWAESYTKLLAFNQTQYHRVLNLDSDSTVLQVRETTSISRS